MTLNAGDARDEYTASSGQTVFNYTFKIYASTDLNVYQTPAGQECSDSDLITTYTVAGVGAEAGGTITLNSGATSGDLITIVSAIPTDRTVDYQNNGDFRPDTVNDDFDKSYSLIKQIEDVANRSLQFPPCLQSASSLTLPAPEDNRYVRWKSDLSGLENVDLPNITATAETFGIDDYPALKALTGQSNNAQILVAYRSTEDDGGGGTFRWDSSDNSTNVTNDPGQGIYVPPNSDVSGVSGCWVRHDGPWALGIAYAAWYGAVSDGATDNFAAFVLARDSGYSQIVLGDGSYYMEGDLDLSVAEQRWVGSTIRGTDIRLGTASSKITLSGARTILEYITVDGDYVADYCVVMAADSQSPSLKWCNIQNAEVENVLIDEGCTSWRIIDGTIRNAGNRDATTILTAGAHCLHIKSIGEIRGTIISGATGRGLKLTGNAATEENRVNFIGGRVNFCYGGLIEVDGTSHNKLTTLNLIGTYLENPGIVANSSASNTSDIESVYANGDGAVINVYQPLKHLIRNAKYAYYADNNAEINVDHSTAVRAQDLGSTAKAILFGQANGGKINVRSWPRIFGDSTEDDFTDWDSLVDLTPAKNIGIYSEHMKKYLEVINGTSLTGLSSSAVNLSVDKTAGNFLTEGSSIKIEGDGSTSSAASITITVAIPENLVGHYVAFVAPIKFEQVGGTWGGGVGVPRSRIRANATGVMFPEPSDSQTLELSAPGAGVQTDWYYHVTYSYIEAAGNATVVINLDTRSQVRDDIAYLDRCDVFVVDNGLSVADIETTDTGYLTGSGSPSGSVTPDYVGQEYLDTSGNAWYKSYGTTNTDWQAL